MNFYGEIGVIVAQEIVVLLATERNRHFTPLVQKNAEKYGVSDNAIRKWCKAVNLPTKKTDIKKYNDKEWELL